jgi:hypothetical protein
VRFGGAPFVEIDLRVRRQRVQVLYHVGVRVPRSGRAR